MTTAVASTVGAPRRPSSSWVRTVATVLAPFVTLVVLWQMSAVLTDLPDNFYPRPLPSAEALWEIIRKGILPAYVVESMGRWGLGVLVGLFLTLPVAMLFASNRLLRRAFMPLVNFMHAIVEIAWLPLFILWFGSGDAPIVLSIAYVVFFPVLFNTMLGLNSVPDVTVNAVRTLGASRWAVVRHVLLPGSLPSVITGLRIAAGFAFRALIAAEILAATSGLGFMIFAARSTGELERTIAGMVVIGLIWTGLDRFYLRPLELATVERWGLVRRAA